jgi:hypothetical protein
VASLDFNGAPMVRIFDQLPGRESVTNPKQLIPMPNRQFQAYDDSFHGGVRIAVGDVPGQAPVIVTAPGPGSALPVKVFDAQTLQQKQVFFPYGTTFRDGIWVAVANLDATNPTNDILTGPGAGEPLLKIFTGPNYSRASTSFVAFRSGAGTVLSSGSVGTFKADSPVFGVSSVAFGPINGTTRDVLVGSGIGKKAVEATVHLTPGSVANPAPAKRSMFFSKRAPAGVHIASGR